MRVEAVRWRSRGRARSKRERGELEVGRVVGLVEMSARRHTSRSQDLA